MHPVDSQLITAHGDVPDSYETWVSSFGIDNFVKTEFTCGNCFWLALALHCKTKWPIKAKMSGNDVIHCFVINPDGKAVDIYGVRPTEQAPTRYDSELDENCIVVDARPETPSPLNQDYKWAETLVEDFPSHFGIPTHSKK